jgi:alanine racemase
MLNYKLESIAQVLNAQVIGSSNLSISSVIIDSRRAEANSNALFFAIIGEHHDGHLFIGDLYSKGISAFVVSKTNEFSSLFPKATFLVVENTLLALQQLAAFHRSKFSFDVIGITGSNGKTIVKEWLAQMLSPYKRVIRSPKSFNSQVGVPLSVLLLEDNFDLAILEAGISKPFEMMNLEPMVKPTIGVFTNLGSAHQENFVDMESKAREKMKLFANANTLIYCKDYQQIHSLAQEEKLNRNINLFSWSSHEDADVMIVNTAVEANRTKISAKFNFNIFELDIPFSDKASIENVMHCVSTLLFLGFEVEVLQSRLMHLHPVAMRLELKEGVNGCTIINDSYNSDIGSLPIALDFLIQQRQHPNNILILSDILQSGIQPDSLYNQVANMVRAKGIDKIIGIGENISHHSSLFPPNSEFYVNTQQFISAFERQSIKNSAILIKGSRPFQFERISALLEQKTHRTVMEINLNSLVHNLNYFRELLKPKVKVMVMVKAFSYGSGSHEIANLLQYHRVDYLGVAFADEGIALRDAGITIPIVVLNPAFGSYELMIEHNLEPEIFSINSLESFALAVSKSGVNSYPIHIKFDTGMHRLGFMESELPLLTERLSKLSSIMVKSVFSHLVGTDESEHDDFTLEQIDKFNNICNSLSNSLGYKPMKHILNSSGIERFPHAQFDMVRLGIGLYGVSPFYQNKLQNVSSLKTFIAQLRHLNAGVTIGYNRRGVLTRESSIATLPIGYADGLNRRLSNGLGKVMVNGKLAPIVGNISMDTCMIDVTDINTKEGDEVIVFGDTPSIIDIAKSLGTIPYEVLTSISRRVKRIYIQE